VTTGICRNVPDQIRPWVTQRYVTLGTDGFGRSDARAPLRKHFEVDRNFIALAALKGLADEGRLPRARVAAAVDTLGIDPEKADPIGS
jgi:pyruvate dehydrogenase E1 component